MIKEFKSIMAAGRITKRFLSGPLHPNTPSILFCTFPRPASPTSSTYLVGCLSPMWDELIELMMSAATEILRPDLLDILTQR